MSPGADATTTARRVRTGDTTARAEVGAALLRVREGDHRLRAFSRVLAEQALRAGDEVDARLRAGEHLPLAGVPVAVKDDVDLAGLVTTRGSRAVTRPADADAALVTRLRAAGAVVVGTTRTPELCLVPRTESALGGATRNPHDPTRTPGGSSGGSAAAVAAGLVPLATAGDGGGSIRGPAAWCGLPGLKATPGTVGGTGVEGVWSGLGVVGVLGRSLADTALAHDVLADGPSDLVAALAGGTTGPLRVAVSTTRPVGFGPGAGGLHPAWRDAAGRTGRALRDLGHRVAPLRLRLGATGAKFTVRYLRAAHDELATTDDPGAAEPGTRLLARLGRASGPLTGWSRDVRREVAAVEASLRGADVLVTPTMPCPPPRVGETARLPGVLTSLRDERRAAFCYPWNLLGWCGLTLPVGVDDDGLPVGVLLTARPHQEHLLLALAGELERAGALPPVGPPVSPAGPAPARGARTPPPPRR
ncbi:amidase [Angustibacter speluncae]